MIVYMMEDYTLTSMVSDTSTNPPTRRFYGPDGKELPASYPAPVGDEWMDWKEIDEQTWRSIPDLYRQRMIEDARNPRDIYEGLTDDQISGRAEI